MIIRQTAYTSHAARPRASQWFQYSAPSSFHLYATPNLDHCSGLEPDIAPPSSASVAAMRGYGAGASAQLAPPCLCRGSRHMQTTTPLAAEHSPLSPHSHLLPGIATPSTAHTSPGASQTTDEQTGVGAGGHLATAGKSASGAQGSSGSATPPPVRSGSGLNASVQTPPRHKSQGHGRPATAAAICKTGCHLALPDMDS